MSNLTDKKELKQKKNGDKDGKALFKLMNNAAYGKSFENIRNKIDVKLVGNEKEYLKWTSKLTLYVTKDI